MKTRVTKFECLVSEFIPQENLGQIPQELKKSSFYLNMKVLEENGKQNNDLNNQQMLNPPFIDQKPTQTHAFEKQDHQKTQPKTLSQFRSQLAGLKKHLQNIFEENQQISNKINQFRKNINNFQLLPKQKGQSQRSKRGGSSQRYQLLQDQQRKSNFHSKSKEKGKKVQKQRSPLSNQHEIHNQPKKNSMNFPPKSEKKAPKSIQKTSVRKQNCLKESMEQIFKGIKLPHSSNKQQIANSLAATDRYCGLLKQMKSYVLKPQSMKIFKIHLVSLSYFGGWINQTESYHCDYKDVLGIIIMGANLHIWMPYKDLMKLQFSSDQQISCFYENMNKMWN